MKRSRKHIDFSPHMTLWASKCSLPPPPSIKRNKPGRVMRCVPYWLSRRPPCFSKLESSVSEIFGGFYMRSRISIRGCFRPSIGPSVGPSVGTFVRPSICRFVCRSHKSWISEKWAEFFQNSTRNMKLSHLTDNWETNTRQDCQNASDVRTPSDLFLGANGRTKKWIDKPFPGDK